MTHRTDSVTENDSAKRNGSSRCGNRALRNRLRLNQHQTLQHEIRVVGDDFGDVIGKIK